jgi:hypothetical protein
MMLLSILLKSYAFALGVAHRQVFAACWAASLVVDFAGLVHPYLRDPVRRRTAVANVILLNVGTGLLGLTIQQTLAWTTMRWKEGLPGLSNLASFLLHALGAPAASVQGDLILTTMTGPLGFAVSLDNLGLFVPGSIAGFAAVYLLLAVPSGREVLRRLAWAGGILILIALLRLVLSVALFLAVCDFVSYESDELPVGPFVKPATVAWMYLPFLLAFWPLLNRALLQPAGVSQPSLGLSSNGPPAPRSSPVLSGQSRLVPSRPSAWALGLVLMVLFLVAFWQPKGHLKRGRVLINTFHTQWSRTDRPYDRDWYGADSGYNYACLKRWFEVFYDVREAKTRLQASDLEGASVLIIYLPDQPFTEDEQRLILEFVRRGGGLFLIGDHTNVFGSTSHLNELCRAFGFVFRDDVLFDQEEDFFQRFDVPRLRSSFLHGIDFFKFRGAASIQPTSLGTRPVIHVDNTKSLRAIYSVNNFYPPPHDHPTMTTGRFCVAAASRFGQGRVFAFADSTVFSNFEIFYPGKYELLLNVVHWLNHADDSLGAYLRRCSLVAACLCIAWFLSRTRSPRSCLHTVIAVLIAFHTARAGALLAEEARTDFPSPVRPARALFFIADGDDPVYVLRAFTSQEPYDQRYDILVQWVLRTGAFSGFYVSNPRHGADLLEHLQHAPQVETGLALLVRAPPQLPLMQQLTNAPGAATKRVMLAFSRQLSWEQIAGALQTSGIVVDADGLAKAKAAWPAGEVTLQQGQRRVLLVFSSERFCDQAMGFSEKVAPSDAQKVLFAEAYSLLDALFSGAGAKIDQTASLKPTPQARPVTK